MINIKKMCCIVLMVLFVCSAIVVAAPTDERIVSFKSTGDFYSGDVITPGGSLTLTIKTDDLLPEDLTVKMCSEEAIYGGKKYFVPGTASKQYSERYDDTTYACSGEWVSLTECKFKTFEEGIQYMSCTPEFRAFKPGKYEVRLFLIRDTLECLELYRVSPGTMGTPADVCWDQKLVDLHLDPAVRTGPVEWIRDGSVKTIGDFVADDMGATSNEISAILESYQPSEVFVGVHICSDWNGTRKVPGDCLNTETGDGHWSSAPAESSCFPVFPWGTVFTPYYYVQTEYVNHYMDWVCDGIVFNHYEPGTYQALLAMSSLNGGCSHESRVGRGPYLLNPECGDTEVFKITLV